MLGADDGEVPVVKRRDIGLSVSFGECDEACVGSAEWKADVAGDEFGCALPVVDGEVFDDDVAGDDAVVQESLDIGSEFTFDEVMRLPR